MPANCSALGASAASARCASRGSRCAATAPRWTKSTREAIRCSRRTLWGWNFPRPPMMRRSPWCLRLARPRLPWSSAPQKFSIELSSENDTDVSDAPAESTLSYSQVAMRQCFLVSIAHTTYDTKTTNTDKQTFIVCERSIPSFHGQPKGSYVRGALLSPRSPPPNIDHIHFLNCLMTFEHSHDFRFALTRRALTANTKNDGAFLVGIWPGLLF